MIPVIPTEQSGDGWNHGVSLFVSLGLVMCDRKQEVFHDFYRINTSKNQ